jgi:hypothetical protein
MRQAKTLPALFALSLLCGAIVACSSSSSSGPGGGVADSSLPDAAEGTGEGDAASTVPEDTGVRDASPGATLDADASVESLDSSVTTEAGPDAGSADAASDSESAGDSASGSDSAPTTESDSAVADSAVAEASTRDGATTDAADAAEAAAAADSGVDAAQAEGEDSGGDGGTSSYAIILASQGADCASCAQTNCLGAGQTCESLEPVVADGGPSSGTTRTALCYDALSCVLNQNVACYNLSAGVVSCYCGNESTTQCENDGPATGAACATQEEDGLETTDPATAWTRIQSSDTTLGAQMANSIVNCLLDSVCSSCVPF